MSIPRVLAVWSAPIGARSVRLSLARIVPLILVELLGLGALIGAIRSLSMPMAQDIPIMNYIAWRILAGDIPYRDIFDVNSPGTYWLHMFALRLFGPSDFGSALFGLAWVAFSALALALYCRPHGKRATCMAILLWTALYFGQTFKELGQRDFLLVPFLLLSAHSFACALESRQHALDLPLAGFWIGCAAIVKPFALCLLVLFGFVQVVIGIRERSARNLVRSLALLGVGGTLAPFMALVWLYVIGGLPAFIDVLTGFLLPIYSSIQTPSSSSIPFTLAGTLRWFLPGMLLAVWSAARSGNRIRYGVLAIAVVYGIFHFTSQDKGWYYHLFPLWYFASALVALAISDFMDSPDRRAHWASVGALLVLSVGLLWNLTAQIVSDLSPKALRPNVEQLLQDLKSYELEPNDRIQVMDATSGGIQVLYLLQVRQPTRFIYDFQFFYRPDLPAVQALRTEFLHDLRAHPPKLMILFQRPLEPPYSLDRLLTFPELVAFLGEDYTVAESATEYIVLLRRPEATIAHDIP